MSNSPTSQPSTSKARIPRTRTGCWTCRDRSVKCDEVRPRCRKCQKADSTCQYGIRLQWFEDSVARGVRHGRQGVWRPKRDYAARDSFPPNALPKARFREPPGSTQYRARSKGVVYFLNTSSRDIQRYWQSQAHHEGLDRTVIFDEASTDDEEDAMNCLAVARSSVNEDRDPISSRHQHNHSLFQWRLTPLHGEFFAFASPIKQTDEYVLKFYTAVVCSAASLIDDQQNNPSRYLILPMAAHSSLVLNAILAVGGVRLAYHDARFRHRALVHRQRVLADLNAFLQNIPSDTTKCLEALITAVMLCWYEISDHCRPAWTSHVVGISGLIDACLRQANKSADFEALLQFSQQYLIYHIVMAKSTFQIDGVIPNSKYIMSRLLDTGGTTANSHSDLHTVGKEGPFSSAVARVLSGVHQKPEAWTGTCFSSSSLGSDLDEIDPLQGFSNRLLLVINEICDLRDYHDSSDMGEGTTTLECMVGQIQSRLETLTQLPPKGVSRLSEGLHTCHNNSTAPEEIQRDRLELIRMTAETHRLAALLFLDETCATYFPHLIPVCRSNRTYHIQRILTIVQRICDTGPITAALPIWPVFLAGCLASTDDSRLQVLEIFDKFERLGRFGSLPPAFAVVQMVWRQSDLGCDENHRKASPPMSSSSSSRIRCNAREGRRLSPNASCAQRTRYPWERAMSMIRGSLLSLT